MKSKLYKAAQDFWKKKPEYPSLVESFIGGANWQKQQDVEIEIPVQLEKHHLAEFEDYLNRHCFKFKKKNSGGVDMFTIQIAEAMDAFWIGSNLQFIAVNKAGWKSNLTK